MHLSRLVIAGALLLHSAVAAADEPPPVPRAPSAAPMYAPPMYAPPPPYVPRLRYKRHSLALMAGGISLTALGVLSILGGITAIVEDARNHDDGILALIVGTPLIIHGAGCIGGGIPMWRIGDRTIPAGWAGLVPSLSVGKKSTVTWTF
jgi:hypothetical protein